MTRNLPAVFVFSAVLVCIGTASIVAAGQARGRNSGIPRTANGKPNFTGVYAGPSYPPGGDFAALKIDPKDPVTRTDALDWRTLPPLTELGEKMFLRKHTGI